MDQLKVLELEVLKSSREDQDINLNEVQFHDLYKSVRAEKYSKSLNSVPSGLTSSRETLTKSCDKHGFITGNYKLQADPCSHEVRETYLSLMIRIP